MEKERELQKSVDEGHQPWRLNPADVAYESIVATIDKNIKYEKCSLITQSDDEAIVQCAGIQNNYKVYLKRFFGKKSIWTAMKIQKSRTIKEHVK